MLINTLIFLSLLSLNFLILYYIYFFNRLNSHLKIDSNFSQPVSIIICAKDEEENLKNNLPKILVQKYFNYEVVVVNDQSNDGTAILLEKLKRQYLNLTVVNIEEHIKHKIGKKFALTLGIKTAKNEYLLLTDADCIPKSDLWLKKMCSNFNFSDIILGYGSYKKINGLLNKLIRFDTFIVAQQYMSYSLAGFTYMGVGRNLAYKKSLFFNNKGFASHMHIPSGDDDLYIQEIAKKNSISINMEDDAHTISESAINWKEWKYQKRRHISTAPLYKTKFKILLSLYPLSQLIFFLSIMILFVLEFNIFFITTLIFIRLFVSYLLNYKTMKKLNVLDLYWIHPLYELLHLFIQGNFVLLNLFSQPKEWSE